MSDPAFPHPQELRCRAAQARRAASIRTTSGQAADRQLVALAIRLERLANAIEGDAATKPPPTD
jgi:hypothetical protein